jgi:hypothetical protein
MSGTWGAPADFRAVCKRAGGRRRYNAERQNQQNWRRNTIICRTAGLPRNTWGLQAALARALGVSRATICRDLKAIRDGYVPQRLRPVRVYVNSTRDGGGAPWDR